MFKGYEEFAAFHEANVDAALRGTTAVGRGADDLQAAVLALTRGARNRAVSAVMAAPRCRDVHDIVQLHSVVVHGLFEMVVTEGRTIAGIYARSARGAVQPVQQRLLAGVALAARGHAA